MIKHNNLTLLFIIMQHMICTNYREPSGTG